MGEITFDYGSPHNYLWVGDGASQSDIFSHLRAPFFLWKHDFRHNVNRFRLESDLDQVFPVRIFTHTFLSLFRIILRRISWLHSFQVFSELLWCIFHHSTLSLFKFLSYLLPLFVVQRLIPALYIFYRFKLLFRVFWYLFYLFFILLLPFLDFEK
jgi:hypothetical protein